MVRIITVLTLLACLSGMVLSAFYQYAAPQIAQNAEHKKKLAMQEVLPDGDEFKEKTDGSGEDKFVYYEALDKNGSIVGYTFEAEGMGFSDVIKVMTAVDKNAEKIVAFKVLKQSETPGLGAKIVDTDFRDKYAGLSLTEKIGVVKSQVDKKENDIVAITGATISSQAVTDMMNAYASKIRNAVSK